MIRCTICARLGFFDVWVPRDTVVEHVETHVRKEYAEQVSARHAQHAPENPKLERQFNHIMRWPDGAPVVVDCELTPEKIIRKGR